MKVKVLVAAMALAATGTANAAIQVTSSNPAVDGGLFLSVINPAATESNSQSFHMNLNVLSLDMLSHISDTSYTLSYDLNALSGGMWSTFANADNGGADMRFMVTGGSNILSGTTRETLPNFLSTGQADPITGKFDTYNDITAANNSMYTQAANLNSLAGGGDYAVADYGQIGYYDNPLYWGDFGKGLGSIAPLSGSVGTSLAMYDIYTVTPTSNASAQFAGVWTLSQSGMLTYSAVPVPAAVWLFGSGLVGLAGIARRRKA